MSTEYEPGGCNIGRAERRKRYLLGAAGFGVAALVAAAVGWLALPSWALLLTAVPLVVGFEGLYQGWLGFCAGFAQRGVYDVSDAGVERHEVEGEDARRADRRRARRIHLYAVGSAAVVTVAVAAIVFLG